MHTQVPLPKPGPSSIRWWKELQTENPDFPQTESHNCCFRKKYIYYFFFQREKKIRQSKFTLEFVTPAKYQLRQKSWFLEVENLTLLYRIRAPSKVERTVHELPFLPACLPTWLPHCSLLKPLPWPQSSARSSCRPAIQLWCVWPQRACHTFPRDPKFQPSSQEYLSCPYTQQNEACLHYIIYCIIGHIIAHASQARNRKSNSILHMCTDHLPGTDKY